jgi:hypothetical protein
VAAVRFRLIIGMDSLAGWLDLDARSNFAAAMVLESLHCESRQIRESRGEN